MRARLYCLSVIFCVMTSGVFSVGVSMPSLPAAGGVQTTSSVALTDDEIARMNAEASTAASQFSNKGFIGQLQTVAKAGVTALTNPFMTIYSMVAPLGMFAYGFVEQAFQSIKNTDYMGSDLSITVDPKAQWSALVSAEKAAAKKVAGLGGAPAAATQPSASAGPTVQQLEETGWVRQYSGGPVGIKFDFGFAGAGDDLTQPYGFMRSVSTGKYYYRPVRGQMMPAQMPLAGKSYAVDFRQRPFNVLVPKLMLSLLGKEIATPIWNSVLDFTQLDPVKIFIVKSMLLFSSAIKNSFQRVDTKTVAATSATDQAQVYTKTSWSTYRSVDKGSKYPTLANIQTEIAKLVQRLKITPDIKRTVKANGGETLPSKWDPSKIVYLGNVNPGLILLSVLPDTLKILLNKLFSMNVNFYEFQLAIDTQNKLKPSDIEQLYGFIRSCETSEDALSKMQDAASQGQYLDAYIIKLQELQNRISSIVWAGGSQNFTDMMKLFFLIRWMLKDFYAGIEFIISRYEQPSTVLAGGQASGSTAASSQFASGSKSAEGGWQDRSVTTDAMLGDSYGRIIDFDLFANKVLPGRVAEFKKYAAFVRTYVNSFMANSIGNSSIDARYMHMTPAKTLTDFSVALGGPDDLQTYFPPVMMKKTLSDYVTAVGKEADAALATIDAEVASLNAVIARARAADDTYDAAALEAANGGASVPSVVENAMIATSDDLITELRKRANNAQDFGLYPLGYDEKLLKTVTLPGAVYLAYCLNFQSRLLSRPFEGDALYAYDDSFYDDDSAYMYLLSVLMRANEDLSRASAVVSAFAGPVTFKDADGKPYTVPNGADFYLNALKKYDQYYLLQEQNLRKVAAASGIASVEYQKAQQLYSNAQKLLTQKKREMNNLLRTFEFDRRKGAMYTPLSVASSQALTLIGKGEDLVGGGSLVSGAQTGASTQVAASDATQVSRAASAEDLKVGIVGYFADGSPVYSYERSVMGFLQAELARFAFRSSMLKLDDLKELVFAVTGIQAEELWSGMEAKKRALFAEQQVAGKAAQAPAVAEMPDDQATLDQLISDGDLLESDNDTSVAEEPTVVDASSAPVRSGDSSTVVAPNIVSAAPASVASADAGPSVVTAQENSSTGAVAQAVTSAQPQPVQSSASRETALLQVSDLDAAFAAAAASGKSSFNDAAGLMALKAKLVDVFAEGQGAAQAQNGQLFSLYILKIVGLAAQVLDPSDDVKLAFVDALQQAMSLLAFGGEAEKFGDINSFDNLLEVVTYLKSGTLASQASALSVMESQLNSWLQSH